MLKLDMDKTIISRYGKIILIGGLILGVFVFLWYNSIVYDEDKITILQAISYSLSASLILLLVLIFRKYSFYLYLILLFFIIVNFFFIDLYDRIKISTIGDKTIAIVISKDVIKNDVSKYKSKSYYITYQYKNNLDDIQKKELVSYKIYSSKNIGDKLDIYSIGEKSVIYGSVPYGYIIGIIIFTFVVINLGYTFIKKGTIINTSNDI